MVTENIYKSYCNININSVYFPLFKSPQVFKIIKVRKHAQIDKFFKITERSTSFPNLLYTIT